MLRDYVSICHLLSTAASAILHQRDDTLKNMPQDLIGSALMPVTLSEGLHKPMEYAPCMLQQMVSNITVSCISVHNELSAVT
jgi:hypothetical protein